jgi:hypothetical protein
MDWCDSIAMQISSDILKVNPAIGGFSKEYS